MRGAEDVNKLPSWARNRIEVLTRDVAHWKREAGIVQNAQREDEGIVWSNTFTEYTRIPPRSHVIFNIARDGEPIERITCSIRDGAVQISGDWVLRLELEASNLMRVTSHR